MDMRATFVAGVPGAAGMFGSMWVILKSACYLESIVIKYVAGYA